MNLRELDSFKLSDAITFHDTLNPKLWRGQNLRPEVKEQLLVIAQDFLTELGIDNLDVKDITVSGSNAAFSYTPHSDLDLHILVDMSEMDNDEIYKELFNAKKTIYNDSHDITIHGVPVELYVQDAREPVVSLGEYSVLDDKWLRIPTKRRANFDQTATKAKYEKLLDIVKLALRTKKLSTLEKILKKIRQYRQAGLDKAGEFGPENLAYKALRSQGYITKLYALKDKLHSELLTIETMYQDPVKIQEKINSKITTKDFRAEKDINIKDVGPLKLVAYNISDDYPQQFKVDVIHPDGKKIGYFRFVVHDYEPEPKFKLFSKFKEKKDPYVLAGNVSVWSQFQKKGIASEVYKWVKSMGNDIKPSSTQTPAGKAMWRGFEKNQIAAEDNTMQYAASKTAAINPYGGLKDRQYRGAIAETFDKPYPIKWEKSEFGDYDALATLPDGNPLTIMFNHESPEEVVITFWRNNNLELTGEGDAQRVFATVLQAIQEFLKLEQPEIISFSASKEVEPGQNMMSRSKLYDRLVKRYAQQWGYNANTVDHEEGVVYNLTRKQNVAEASGPQFVYHITPTKNLKSIAKQGLKPTVGDRSSQIAGEKSGIYVFPDKISAEDAVMNWLGDEFEDEPLTMLKIDVSGLQDHISKGADYELIVGTTIEPNRIKRLNVQLEEASGYIPSEKEKNDPRFKTALTVDVKPDSIKKNAKAFYSKVSRAGIPPTAKSNGKF